MKRIEERELEAAGRRLELRHAPDLSYAPGPPSRARDDLVGDVLGGDLPAGRTRAV
jgi:hypothetical protein